MVIAMSNQETVDQLKRLALHGMTQALESQLESPEIQKMPFTERLSLLADAEQHYRDNRRQQRLLNQSKLKMRNAYLEDVNYSYRRGLDRSLISSLVSSQWIERSQHLLITGPTGVGKTWIACAFGVQAIRCGMPVSYFRVNRLLEDTEIARADGSLPKLRAKLLKSKLLILDDWGLAPLTDIGRQDLLEYVDDRTGSGSLVIASQLPVKAWYDYINEPTLADAILDRIVHRAHKIEMHGGSVRKKLGL